MGKRRMNTDTEIVEKRIRPAVPAEDWVDPSPGDPAWSTDQVIGAWTAGINEGIKTALETLKTWAVEIRDNNINSAGDHTQQVLDFVKQRGLNPSAAILNANQFNELRVLIFLPLDEYTGELFRGVYSEIGKWERTWEEPNYSIEFSFTSHDEGINESLLRADGYILHHKSLLPE